MLSRRKDRGTGKPQGRLLALLIFAALAAAAAGTPETAASSSTLSGSSDCRPGYFKVSRVVGFEGRCRDGRLHGLVIQGRNPTLSGWSQIARGRVGTIRFLVNWQKIERDRGVYNWSTMDEQVRRASRTGAELVPFIWGSPGWLESAAARPPLGPAGIPAWRRFNEAVARRYGPGTRFWRGAPGGGITAWQIWNEANHSVFFAPHPRATDYARLLRVAASAIRGVNPKAEIVLSGLTPLGANHDPITYLRHLFSIPGVSSDFDSVAVHPYSRGVRQLALRMRRMRAALNDVGMNQVELRISEFGWASKGPRGLGRTGTARAQASILRRSYRTIARNQRRWRLISASWFAWQDVPQTPGGCSICTHIGLSRVNGTAKPAWTSMTRSIRANLRSTLLGSP